MIAESPLLVATRMSLVLVLALTLQFALASRIEVFGVQGDLLLLVAVTAGLAAGPDRGAIIGFAAGLAFDLLLQSPFGLSALTYALVAYLVGSMQDSFLRAAWWIPVVTATVGSAVGVILYGVFGTVVGEDLLHTSLLKTALIVALLNAVAAPVMVRVVRWGTGTAEGTRYRSVMR
ncbi:MAG: rod shape-determining protein MreD [Acidimicrobiales bacterium]